MKYLDYARELKFEAEEALATCGLVSPIHRSAVVRRIAQAGLLFIHVPRNGGTSVASALGLPFSSHHSARFYKSALGSGFSNVHCIAILRDPIDRFLSSYFFVRGGGTPQIPLSSNYKRQTKSIKTIDQYIAYLTSRRGSVDSLDPVMRTQAFFVLDSNGSPIPQTMGPIDYIIRHIKSLGHSPIEHLNQSIRKNVRLTDDQVRVIRKLYEIDFDLFNAYRDPGNERRTQRRFYSPARNPVRTKQIQTRRIAFLWENFGHMHHDRCAAVAAAGVGEIIGLELYERSKVYKWEQTRELNYKKVTLSTRSEHASDTSALWQVVFACMRAKITHAFFCHYELPYIWLAATLLRLMGKKVYVMNDSKFDDYKRSLGREVVKFIAHAPYCGGLAASPRSADYMRFLGHSKYNIALGYDSISVNRCRETVAAFTEPNFHARDFVVVARLVEKKNLIVAIEAYKIFSDTDSLGRRLHICGSGELEELLRSYVLQRGLQELVIFHGHQPIERVLEIMAGALALVVTSTEEQYGIVIAEAQSIGLPVIASTVCGACDEIVRGGVNGFIVEPYNTLGYAFFMRLVANNNDLWNSLKIASMETHGLIDTSRFVDGVKTLIAATR